MRWLIRWINKAIVMRLVVRQRDKITLLCFTRISRLPGAIGTRRGAGWDGMSHYEAYKGSLEDVTSGQTGVCPSLFTVLIYYML
jgi:hypothetical protein